MYVYIYLFIHIFFGKSSAFRSARQLYARFGNAVLLVGMRCPVLRLLQNFRYWSKRTIFDIRLDLAVRRCRLATTQGVPYLGSNFVFGANDELVQP